MAATNRRKLAVVTMLLEMVEEQSSCDSSSSDSDDDNGIPDDLLILYNMFIVNNTREDPQVIPKVTGFVDRVVPGYSADTFKEHFRMFPNTFEAVLRVIGPGLRAVNAGSGGRPGVDPHKQLLVTLWFMGTPDSFWSVATQFGMGKTTTFRIVKRVSYALYCVAKRFIRWPKTTDAVEEVTEKFKAAKRFPGVIGAIDGSHIAIRAPQEDHVSYINRKGFHSIILQAVCDGRSVFTHCYAGPVGSVHDARVFRNSPVARFLESPDEYFPNNTHLLGDAAYPLSTHMLVPFKDNGHLTARQKNYNYRHSSTRMAIERAFGLLKVRFRILLDCLPLTDILKIPEFIIAWCVLHNICMAQDDFFQFNDEEIQNIEGQGEAFVAESGVDKRNRIMNDLPL